MEVIYTCMSYIILTPVIEVDQKYAGIEVRILHGILQYVIAGWFIDHFQGNRIAHVAGMAAGTAVCYVFGTVWLAGQLGISFTAGLGAGVIPYLPGDAAKIALAVLIGPTLRKEIRRLSRQ